MTMMLRGFAVALLAGLLLAGCSTTGGNRVMPTPARYAQQEIDENRLLDVGIVLFESTDPEDAADEETYNPDIRQAETKFIPYELRATLQATGYWGTVAVIPNDSAVTDVYVFGDIVRSDGGELVVDISVSDVTGVGWFSRRYRAEIDDAQYQQARRQRSDPYQDFYNTLSNDLLAHRERLPTDQLRDIHRVARLKFAGMLAPDAFGNYLQRDAEGILRLAHLPSDDDPMMRRVTRIRDRDLMLVDTLNAYYGEFHEEMRDPYLEWRELSFYEAQARAELKQKALTRRLLGVAAFAAAIANEAYGGNNTSHAATALLAYGGYKAFEAGQEYADSASIHTDAIQELTVSFGEEISPAVIEVEGHRVRLSGSAEQQYREWQSLMRELYQAETGFSVSSSAVLGDSPRPDYGFPGNRP